MKRENGWNDLASDLARGDITENISHRGGQTQRAERS
jgi:hypothetical protein